MPNAAGTPPPPGADAFAPALQATAAWRREAACHPAEYDRRQQVLLRLEAIAREVRGPR